jgi:hypothetical protein
MRPIALLLCTLLAGSLGGPAVAAPTVRTVEVTGARVSLAELMPALGEGVAGVDLGRAPAPGGSRVISRQDIEQALAEQQIQGVKAIPAAVRVVRKMDGLGADRLGALTREALSRAGLAKGLTLTAVRPTSRASVAAGWEQVTVSVPKPPRRAGAWATTVMLEFVVAGDRVARVAVPVTFDVSPEAAAPDVAKGDRLTLLVRHGLIEVRVPAHAAAAADVGQTVPVTLRPSGRMVRARLVAKDEAVALGSDESS